MRSRDNRVDASAVHNWFDELPLDAIGEFIEHSAKRSLADKELLYRRGDEPEGLYGILSGRIRISAVSAEGKELLVTHFNKGSWLAEVSLLDGLPRTHDAHAEGPTEILWLPRKKFQEIMQRRPELYRYFVAMLCRKLRATLRVVEDAAFLPLPARIAKQVLALAGVYGTASPHGTLIDIHLPQEDLARMLRTSRQSISKNLKAWEARGWVRIEYGRLTLRNRAAIQKLAGG